MHTFCGNCFVETDRNSVCPHCGFDNDEEGISRKSLPKGTLLNDRFRIGRVLGVGGFSITYKAYDTVLKQIVAIKEYFPNEFSTRMPMQIGITIYTGYKEEQFHAGKQRFMEEAKKLAKFQYGNDTIVHVYDCFDENQTSYIVMEYVEGKTLAQVIRENGCISSDKAVLIAVDILDALAQVHQTGILHRDISPDNIIVKKDGTVKLIDFGAARYATTIHSKSLSMIVKPGYAPIEQYRSNGDQGPWTDVYGVAATLYKMITSVTPSDAMERSVKDDLKRPSRMGVRIDKHTENAIMNALNVPIEGRPRTAEEFKAQLLSDKVSRKKVKRKREDTGKIPIWMFIFLTFMLVLVVVGLVLIQSGKISFQVSSLQSLILGEGEARVPNIVNTDISDAQKQVEEQELVFVIADKEYSDAIPKDKVLLQSLEAGSIVEKKSRMEVTVSGGEKETDVPEIADDETIVPDVQYKTQEEAVILLEAAGLQAEITYEQSDIVETGHVISQNIAADNVVKKGETVFLSVSRRVERETQTGQEETIETQPPQETQQQVPQPETPQAQQPQDTTTQEGEWQTDYELEW